MIMITTHELSDEYDYSYSFSINWVKIWIWAESDFEGIFVIFDDFWWIWIWFDPFFADFGEYEYDLMIWLMIWIWLKWVGTWWIYVNMIWIWSEHELIMINHRSDQSCTCITDQQISNLRWKDFTQRACHVHISSTNGPKEMHPKEAQ